MVIVSMFTEPEIKQVRDEATQLKDTVIGFFPFIKSAEMMGR